jgi:serine/threonine protein kinase
MFYEGRQIGSYRLLRKLGKGGFGEVWLAEKRSQFVTKKVAVKLPLDEQVNFDAIRQEAELWEQASGHPNVLPIIDADVLDGQVLIVSEYADGGSLADRLKREGKLPLQKAVEMTIGILNGLEFLHNRKIIHRDIKPQNILLQGDTPRLADFGISRAMNTTIVSSTIIGTDAYMSPESFDGKRNVQTDIWSVGIVLYALLADKLPFPQEHPSERMFAILTKEFAPLPAEVPPNLQKITAKALAKQPENRYQTTTEMRDELQKALLGIAHPTFAPTEVFRIPTENLPTIPTLENRYETDKAEKKTVISQPPVNFPAPTQAAFPQESIATNLKANPPITNESEFSSSQEPNRPSAAQFQIVGNQMPNRPPTSANSPSSMIGKNKGLIFGIAAGALLLLFIGLIFVVDKIMTRSTVSNRANASNSSTVSPSNVSTTNMSFPLNIEIKTKDGAWVDLNIDDGKSEVFHDTITTEKKFTAQESLRIEYARVSRDDIQLRINGKDITLPKDSGDGSPTITFEITKNNYNRILQPGTNASQLIVNTNTAPNSASNSAFNSYPNTTSTAEMVINLSATKKVSIVTKMDDDKDVVYVANPETFREFKRIQKLTLTYRKEDASFIGLKINNKTIEVPTNDQTDSKTIKIEIKKDNLNQILQSGKISQ